MFDIWAFLLQTLTASGTAVLLLVVKAMFRDKLPPKWQFAIWGVPGLSLIVPAGIGGRYVLFNWPLVVETLKSVLAGEYTFTKVLFPFPAPELSVPRTVSQWLFLIYGLGVAAHLAKYAVSYLRLRFVLRKGMEPNPDQMNRIRKIAEGQNVSLGSVVVVPNLPSAFVCGVFHPILALPADSELDDKVLLHELLHLKFRDTVWSIVICLLRCIHWCNPLLIYCADEAGNDLEARCDQRVLELLEGEERRDYGRILLSMANDRFAKTPGATCVNNGGSNIRKRIEAIARFKLYPAGMELVSVCAAIILVFPMALGVQATEVVSEEFSMEVALASARITYCTTPAGAFDAYGKAVLDQNGVYRAMCAPESMQEELAEAVLDRYQQNYPYWDAGLPAWPNSQTGYYIYNLEKADGGYEGLLVIELNYPPDGQPGEDGMMYLAVQNLRVEKENGRWVVIPLDEFQAIETTKESIAWGCHGLPAYHYSETACDFLIDISFQTVYEVDNTIVQDTNWFSGTTTSYDLTPKPNAEFSTEAWFQSNTITHLGTEAERDEITQIGLSIARVMEGEIRPELFAPGFNVSSSGTDNHGASWSNRSLDPGWGPVIADLGGGSKFEADMDDTHLPAYYAADLYLNNKFAAELTLALQEGGAK